MGKFAKKIFINQVKNIDRERTADMPNKKLFSTAQIRTAMHKEKASNYIREDELLKLIVVARGHALWLHMTVLKETFKFTSKQLLTFREKLSEVLKHAIDDTSGGSFADIVKNTINVDPKRGDGGLGLYNYKPDEFDKDGHEMDRVEAIGCDSPLVVYKKFKRTFIEFNKVEVASMLVLHDHFGFRKIRLQRFIDTIRETYNKGITDHLKKMDYLEKLCKTRFSEFDPIRYGKGIYGKGVKAS